MTEPAGTARPVPRGPFTAIAALAVVLVTVLALREVASLVVPVIFGLFLAMVAWPLAATLERRGIGRGPAMALAISTVVLIVLVAFAVIAVSIAELVLEVPRYQARLAEEVESIRRFLEGFGVDTDLDAILSVISPGTIAGVVRQAATEVSQAGIAIFVAVLTMLYALAGGASLRQRAARSFGERHALLTGVEQFGVDLRRYIAVRALLGVFAAVLILVVLLVLSVPLPLLWAFLVFAASFIPNIGTLIALVPTTILALLDGGLTTALIVVGAYTVINFAQDHFLQPIVMGSELNLTPLVVFVAVIAWAWVFGAAGALLAVPLTVGLVAIMEAFPATRPWAALLRSRVEPAAGGDPDPDPFTTPAGA